MSNRQPFAVVVADSTRLSVSGSAELLAQLLPIHSPQAILPSDWPASAFGAGWVNVHFGRRVAPFRPIVEVPCAS